MYLRLLGCDYSGIRGFIPLPPRDLFYHCYSICQWKLFHIKCRSWNESLPSYIICLADSVVFWVLSKMITHRWYLNTIEYIRIISSLVRSTEIAALGLGSVLLAYIAELRVLDFSGWWTEKSPSVPLWIFTTTRFSCARVRGWGEIRGPFRHGVVPRGSGGHSRPACFVSGSMRSGGVCRRGKDRPLSPFSHYRLCVCSSPYLHGVGKGN